MLLSEPSALGSEGVDEKMSKSIEIVERAWLVSELPSLRRLGAAHDSFETIQQVIHLRPLCIFSLSDSKTYM